MKYVGIANSKYKKTLLKNKKSGNIVSLTLPGLAASCTDHFEILDIFDKIGSCRYENFLNTSYVKSHINNGKSSSAVLDKIKKFYKLYSSISDIGFNYKKGYIVVTSDGVRLDGSHRSSIVEHLGMKKVDVIQMNWSDFFSGKDLQKIKRHIASQRSKLL